MIISKAAAIAVAMPWGEQKEQLERKAKMRAESLTFIRCTEYVLRKD